MGHNSPVPGAPGRPELVETVSMYDGNEAGVLNRDVLWYAHLAARLCQATYYGVLTIVLLA